LQQGIKPEEFWRCTFGELKHQLRYLETVDKRQWMHTSQLLALTYNLNRGKTSKAASWEDFNPYEYERRISTPPTTLDSETRAKFERMTKALNRHGKTNGGTTDTVRG